MGTMCSMAENNCCITLNDATCLVRSLIQWEQPWISAVALVAANCFFWLVVSWNRQFISILAIIVLTVFLYRTWVYEIWPTVRVPPSEEDEGEEWIKVNTQGLGVPELSHYIQDFHDKLLIWWRDLMRLRQVNHGMFCLLACAALSLLAFIGHVIPGVIIIYSIVLAVSLGPGIVLHLIPSTIYDQIADLFVEDTTTKPTKKSDKNDSDSDIEEFLPETSPDILRQLSLPQESLECTLGSLVSHIPEEAEDHHLETIRELGMDSYICDSGDNSLYSGLGAFPSVEEENESDLDDDLPVAAPTAAAVEDKNGMHFVNTHFKEDSSESESSDAAFTEGLSFAGVSTPASKEATPIRTTAATGNAQDPQAAISTSSDFDDELMDFEILEKSDIS